MVGATRSCDLRIVDLSQEIHSGMDIFPTFPKPQFVLWTKRETYGFQTEAMFLVTHSGTHVDAPFHFYSKGAKVNSVSVGRLIGRGVVLDFVGRKAKTAIRESDVRRAEEKAGVVPSKGDIVLAMTGWDRFLGRKEYTSSYPGFSRDAAEYLAKKNVSAVGVDSPNPDLPDASDFPVHNTLLPKGILIIENLANLGSIRRNPCRFVGLPLKIRGGTGSPIRAVAIEG